MGSWWVCGHVVWMESCVVGVVTRQGVHMTALYKLVGSLQFGLNFSNCDTG